MNTKIEVTGLTDNDVKTAKGWKKVYSLTMVGLNNGVTVSVNLKSDSLELLEEIAEFDKATQRTISIDPINQTLASFPGGTNQTLVPIDDQEDEEEDQKETLRNMRELLYNTKEEEEAAKKGEDD